MHTYSLLFLVLSCLPICLSPRCRQIGQALLPNRGVFPYAVVRRMASFMLWYRARGWRRFLVCDVDVGVNGEAKGEALTCAQVSGSGAAGAENFLFWR